MPVDLFAGIPVTDYAAALAWYERLFGSPPSFCPNDTEAVWELAEHRYVFVDDLEALVAQVAERGLTPAEQEIYANGVCKAAYRDPDGNEFGFGSAPVA